VNASKTIAALSIAPIEDADIADVVTLWQACGLTRPWNDPSAENIAARLGDMVLQDGPHCHAPIHPPAPVPTPVPHPPLPLTIIKGQPTVLIGNQPAARMTDMTTPCILPGCIPAGPGMINKECGIVRMTRDRIKGKRDCFTVQRDVEGRVSGGHAAAWPAVAGSASRRNRPKVLVRAFAGTH